ncbi:uroporphyrinogen-III C-methyltransferase [Anaerostipes sp.]|uniref:uroporphyrinogen-III C-methyltransferase n=1 Tax=Anaerostipes sp. TaxID=1872530 RepID=UPI0025C31DA9|nr:uroporphyrinogen-III C-methyltransferase [Anaerostipes sp.]MBS7007358.1 uroporphyrinogen-III C-methyltransferase [Anaerostipes sp.]
MKTGKVWLAGAGPGAVGLLTIKAAQVLKTADVIVYDSLVGPEVLSVLPGRARYIYVGKRAGCHTMPQEEISQVLVREAENGYSVVRLKGGDPFMFGRGGEELELLRQHNIPFEVIPGITSPVAVPEYNGIPVTHRNLSSSLHIITGHKKAGAEYDIDFEALVRMKGTLVFLMGISSLPDIVRSLISAGMDPQMPAAVLSKGTTAGQKRVLSPLSELEEAVRRSRLETPAVIVVGRVCSLSEEFAWYEDLPLAGCRILLTRPRDLISKTAAMFREKGAEVLEMPSILIKPKEDQRRLSQSLENIGSYDWIVFTSSNGVRIFFEEMKKQKKDIRILGSCKVAAIGKGTKNALKERGLFCDLMPEIYDGVSLGRALCKLLSGGEHILIPRAASGNRELIKILQEKPGVQIDDVAIYETCHESWKLVPVKEMIETGEIHWAVFTSASTVRGFAAALPDTNIQDIKAACIGEQTAKAAKSLGMDVYTSDKADMESLVRLVTEHQKGGIHG